jgi:hypothetical protein
LKQDESVVIFCYASASVDFESNKQPNKRYLSDIIWVKRSKYQPVMVSMERCFHLENLLKKMKLEDKS